MIEAERKVQGNGLEGGTEELLGVGTKLSQIEVEYVKVIKCQRCLICYLERNASTFM